ncbi:DegT/DnrJ/EryC1/StrS aminotransferase family protein [Daejeonella sp. JGW-45]|uniref:DegT/DnrJ/EryC1/StrS family aminotransferase n=1 Tax=Daejeonella sp. JGW-45 TaxID=3034148 RepID=UPI0023EAFE82|nr:DegT/DnrJ/EryC1/StrS aminotransferase family protein [Daejeonella sp. JGW-45]
MITHSRPTITDEDRLAVDRQLSSGNIAKGTLVNDFQNVFEQYTSVQKCRFVDSGSKAIFMALQILKIGNGDEVILPTYLCHNVLDAVIESGAVPVLCDISDGWNADVNDVEKVFTGRTKCIILVHTMGIAVDVNNFKKFNVPIIEDCCQALGSKNSKGEMVGGIGDFSVFSFHAIKCLTTGEGGMLCTNNEKFLDFVNNKNQIKAIGSSMTDIQAALGISQLNQYQRFLERRAKIANDYIDRIELQSLIADFKRVSPTTNFYRFLIVSDGAFDDIRSYFSNKGIAVRKGVDELLHLSYPQFSRSEYSNAEYILKRTISIPIYPSLTSIQQNKIVDAINTYEKFR